MRTPSGRRPRADAIAESVSCATVRSFRSVRVSIGMVHWRSTSLSVTTYLVAVTGFWESSTSDDDHVPIDLRDR